MSRPDRLDVLRVDVEMRRASHPDEHNAQAARLAIAIKDVIGISAEVRAHAVGTLARSSGKAVRVFRV